MQHAGSFGAGAQNLQQAASSAALSRGCLAPFGTSGNAKTAPPGKATFHLRTLKTCCMLCTEEKIKLNQQSAPQERRNALKTDMRNFFGKLPPGRINL